MTMKLSRILFVGALLLAATADAALAAEKVLKVATGFLSSRRGDPYQGITLPAVFTHHAIFDTLTSVDAQGRVIPSLAVEWRPETAKADVWVFTLRPGVTFNNGEPLTAEALVVSAAHMASPNGRAETIGSQMYQVARVEAVDDVTARVILSESDALFPLHATSWRIPAPKAFTTMDPLAFAANPVGSGPFKVDSWIEGRARLVANRASWRAPKIDAIDIVEMVDETSRMQAFLSGAVNLVLSLSPDQRGAVEQAGGTFFARKTSSVYFLAPVTAYRDNPAKDKRVRQALNLAVNRQAIIDAILGGATTPASQLSIPGSFGYDDDLKPIPYDPAKAKALLAEAGYAQGLKLTAGISAGVRASDITYFQQVAADLEKVGVHLELIGRSLAIQQKQMFGGDLEMDMINMFTRGQDMIVDYRHRACVGTTQGRSPVHCDADVTAAVKAAMAEIEPEKRAALYRRVAQLEHDSPPGIVLWQGVEFDALSKGISGYEPAYDTMRLHLIDIAP
ncbi:MAG: ABC transporter substrate-binding protein [Rhodospirillaceae bacterium]|nr:ABC transporter substrate-binding protein [Rhodospirillaceae bacterium]